MAENNLTTSQKINKRISNLEKLKDKLEKRQWWLTDSQYSWFAKNWLPVEKSKRLWWTELRRTALPYTSTWFWVDLDNFLWWGKWTYQKLWMWDTSENIWTLPFRYAFNPALWTAWIQSIHTPTTLTEVQLPLEAMFTVPWLVRNWYNMYADIKNSLSSTYKWNKQYEQLINDIDNNLWKLKEYHRDAWMFENTAEKNNNDNATNADYLDTLDKDTLEYINSQIQDSALDDRFDE